MTVRTNYIFDPGIEGAIAGYWASSETCAGTPTLERVADPYAGTYALEYSYTAQAADATSYAHIHSNYSGAGTALQNDVFVISAYIKLGAGTTSGIAVRFKLKEYSSAPAYLTETSGTYIQAALTTSYQRFSDVFTVSNASCDRVIASLAVTSIANGDAFDIVMDNMMLEKVSELDDYFDGDTTDTGEWTYAWTGTANQSTSTATSTPWTGLTVIRDLS